MRLFAAAGLALMLAACSQSTAQTNAANVARPAAPAAAPVAAITPVTTTAPAGDYVTDPPHSSLVFRVNHMGFSNFTGRFSNYTARLHLDPAHPAATTLSVEIPISALTLDNPPAGWVEEMLGPQFFDSAHFPSMTFQSTSIQMTAPNQARVTGNLTLHGITRPVVLETTFNGGYPGMAMDPHARIGFSAHGSLKRSDFGMGMGVPAPGTTMGVGDQVDIAIETEMSGPAFQQP